MALSKIASSCLRECRAKYGYTEEQWIIYCKPHVKRGVAQLCTARQVSLAYLEACIGPVLGALAGIVTIKVSENYQPLVNLSAMTLGKLVIYLFI